MVGVLLSEAHGSNRSWKTVLLCRRLVIVNNQHTPAHIIAGHAVVQSVVADAVAPQGQVGACPADRLAILAAARNTKQGVL